MRYNECYEYYINSYEITDFRTLIGFKHDDEYDCLVEQTVGSSLEENNLFEKKITEYIEG